MGAGAEGEAGIEAHDRGIGGLRIIGKFVVPRHDPGARAETHRLELVQPRTFPVLILDLLEAYLGPVEAGIERLQRGQQQQRIGVGIEQRGQGHLAPQRDLADAGFEDRLLVGGIEVRVLQCHRQRADVLQRALDARLLVFAAGQAELQVGHAGKWRGSVRAILAVSTRRWIWRCGEAQPPRMPFSRPFMPGFFFGCWPSSLSSICCMSPKSMPRIAVALERARRRTLHSGFHGCLGSAGLGG